MVGQSLSRRDRYRAQTREEAKRIALRQLAKAGPGALSLNAIAREMGVTGPALYRYFARRDELLTELIVDAYDDLADAVDAAAQQDHLRAPRARLRAIAASYRDWALVQPHRYRLLFGAPVPGYPAHSERTIPAAQRTMDTFLGTLVEILPAPAATPCRRTELDRQLEAWGQRSALRHVAGPVLLRGVTCWSRLHGLISLEIEGNFRSIGVDSELLFDAEVDALLEGAG